MKAPDSVCEAAVRLYADACSSRFVLRQEGQREVREFPSLSDAIRFVTRLRREGALRVILLDPFGNFLTQLVLPPRRTC